MIKNFLTTKIFDFIINYNGASINSVCRKKMGVLSSQYYYNRVRQLKKAGIFDKDRNLTGKGLVLQEAFKKLDELIKG